MKRLLAGAVAAGLILCGFATAPWASAGSPGLLANLFAGFLAALLLLQLGSRSLVEKVLFLLVAASLGWAGRAPWDMTARSLFETLAAWTVAGAALAWLTRPRTE